MLHLHSVILRPVMSMKLSQPGCVGSIEGISSIGSLHVIALFFLLFFSRFPDAKTQLQTYVRVDGTSFPFSTVKLQLPGWCEHLRPSSFSSWHWCGAPWTFRSGTIFAKGNFKEIWSDYSAQKIALQHCGFHVFLWIFFDCGQDTPGNDAETPWSSSVMVRAAALKNSAEMLELDFKETPGGEPKEAKETTKQWTFGPSSVTHYTYYIYLMMTLWSDMKCCFEIQTSELVDLLILPNLKLRCCGRDCGTALGLWTCADVLPKALHTSAGAGLGCDRIVDGGPNSRPPRLIWSQEKKYNSSVIHALL